LFRPIEEYGLIEEALVRIFDELPGIKTSSVAHQPNSAIGIKIGSREIMVGDFEEFIDVIKAFTAELRVQSKKHYKVIHEWYRANNHPPSSDFGTGMGAERFHEFRFQALEYIYCSLNGLNFIFDNQFVPKDDGPPETLEPGDKIVIIGGSPYLIGTVAYIISIDDMRRVLCRYFLGSEPVVRHVNLDDLRLI
jgi:hypothetical protein